MNSSFDFFAIRNTTWYLNIPFKINRWLTFLLYHYSIHYIYYIVFAIVTSIQNLQIFYGIYSVEFRKCVPCGVCDAYVSKLMIYMTWIFRWRFMFVLSNNPKPI